MSVTAYQASADSLWPGSRPTAQRASCKARAGRKQSLSAAELCGLRGAQYLWLPTEFGRPSKLLQSLSSRPRQALLAFCLHAVLRSTRSTCRGFLLSMRPAAHAAPAKRHPKEGFPARVGCAVDLFRLPAQPIARAYAHGFACVPALATPDQWFSFCSAREYTRDTNWPNRFWFSCGAKKRQTVFQLYSGSRSLFAYLNNNTNESRV